MRACSILRDRLAPVAAALLGGKLGRAVDATELVFSGGYVRIAGPAAVELPFAAVCEEAYLQRCFGEDYRLYCATTRRWL